MKPTMSVSDCIVFVTKPDIIFLIVVQINTHKLQFIVTKSNIHEPQIMTLHHIDQNPLLVWAFLWKY